MRAHEAPPTTNDIVASRLPTLSCDTPLTPWPLVQPPARRMPKSSSALPTKACTR